MSGAKIAAIALIVAGGLGLAYGKFSYVKDSDTTSIGPLEFSVKHRQTVNVPVWAGMGAIVLGGVLFVAGSKGART
jgi:hypothetical protein